MSPSRTRCAVFWMGTSCFPGGWANSNHFPAIDIGASISRLMADIVSDEHKRLAARVRDVMGIMREKMPIWFPWGAYKAGTNPRLDYALGKMDGINQFLTQGVDEAFSYEEDLRPCGSSCKRRGTGMKRFQFSLNTVLSYKQQVLEELQNEHGQLLYQVRQQELVLQAAEERYRGLNLEFRQAETEGLTIAEALRYESGLRFLEDEIQREAKRLREYEAAAEEKRRQVVAARQDTASLKSSRTRSGRTIRSRCRRARNC